MDPQGSHKFSFCLFAVLTFLWSASGFCSSTVIAHSDNHALVSIYPSTTNTDAAATCERTLEQFIPALDAVFRENPRSILRYHAVLAKYLFFRSGVPGLPAPDPDASIEGCRLDVVMQIVKQSNFFYEADGPPRYKDYVIEFRNTDARVGFTVEKETGNIIQPRARWVAVYP